MQIFSYRQCNVLGFILILFILSLTTYLESTLHLQPCPLCILQRICFILLGFIFLLGIFLKEYKKKQIIQSLLLLSLAVVGTLFAIRQIWLQHLPKGQAPACMPGINYLIHNLPFTEALSIIFKGSGECADTQWLFLHLSMAEWSLIFFIIFVLAAIFQLSRICSFYEDHSKRRIFY